MDVKKLLGEAADCEIFERLDEKDPGLLRTVSAFANGEGGVLIFATENPQGTSEAIRTLLRERMDPVPPFSIHTRTLDDKPVLLLKIEPGMETPYYCLERTGRTACCRADHQSIVCDAGRLRELQMKESGMTLDSLPSGYEFSKMAFTKLISTYYQRVHGDFQESDFRYWGLVDETGALTFAGALLVDNCPIYQSRIFCTRWDGLDKRDALDSDEYSGSLISLLQEGAAFVRRNSHKGWFKTADSRVELPDYPERAVTEGILNGLIHRDYRVIGSEVHVDIYDDRLEIYSPGGMPDGRNIQGRDPGSIPSRRRNPIIADVFSRLGYMNRRGNGLKTILEDYRNQYCYTPKMAPVFETTVSSFHLTLKNLNYHQTE